MNKQEKNIKDIITLDNPEDIIDIFTESLNTVESTTLITSKEFVEYALREALKYEWVSVEKIDLDVDDIEYMIAVDEYGNMVVQPIEYYDDEYFKDIKFAFVDMDGSVNQMTIDRLLDMDIPIILFGCEDECDCNKCECKCSYSDNLEVDENNHGFSISNSNGNEMWSYSFYSTDKDLVDEMIEFFM